MGRKLSYEFYGESARWWHSDTDGLKYWTTNGNGDGIFFVDSRKNSRTQLVGTNDFSVHGLKDKRRAIRRWMNTDAE